MTRFRVPRRTVLALAVLGLALAMTLARGIEAKPISGLTREQLVAVYPELADGQFQPPACVIGQEMFTDVPATSQFCPWIEELARRGITSGCTATEYCPGNPVSRAQMAVFVVKATETCPTLDPVDEMIRVGGVCIDKYEASIWDAPVGGNQITGTVPCSPNGQDCDNIWARSVAGVLPRGSITWFQAQQALANSGKRLPTNAEWQMAVAGTPDPGDSPGAEDCNTNSAGPEVTGERENCVSRWGVHDMVGNLYEKVADWDEQAAFTCGGWLPEGFSDDCALVGRADGDSPRRQPGAYARGGWWEDGSHAGPFAVASHAEPSGHSVAFGFRGAR